MSYRPGEIYFVRENILGTNDLSSFVKIGLVADDRSSNERLKEHQTGNPRRLHNQAVIETGAVHRVEAMLHRIYAPHRVSGEWFDFKDESLVLEAIERVRALAGEVAKVTPIFDRATELAGQVSGENSIAATAATKEIAARLAIAQTKVDVCTGIRSAISNKFVEALKAGVDVKGAAVEKEVYPKPKFNTTLFKKEQKEKYEEYIKVAPTFSASFKSLVANVDPATLDVEFLQQIDEIEAMVAQVETLEEAYLLNEPLLLVTHLLALAEWDRDIAEAELKVECGTAAGIEGICTWERKASTRSSLDTDKLANLEPELYIQYFLPRDTYTRITVTRKQS